MTAKKYNSKLFEYLDNILVKKDYDLYLEHVSDENFEKDYSKFMIIRYLSMANDIHIQTAITTFQRELELLSPKTQYALLMHCIPLQKSSFIKYLK